MAYDGEIQILTKLNTDTLNADLNSMSGMIGKSLGGINVSVAGVTAGLIAVGKNSFEAGTSFESAFAGVIKTVDATDVELSQMREQFRELAMDIPITANELASIGEAAGQLGIANENILSFTETMANLGVATNLTAEQAATEFARFANIVQMPQENIDRLGSTVVALGNNLATTEGEISSMALRLAAAGDQAGLSEAQIFGFAGALSSLGLEAEAGGTAFSKVFTNINLAVQTGSADLKDFAEVAGMTTAEFSRAFQEDAAGAITAFVTGLGDVERTGKSAIQIIDDIGISEVRMRDALLRTAGSGDLLVNSLDLANIAWEENTALTNEASQRYETMDSQLQLLENSMTNLGISIYDSLREPLTASVGVLRTIVDGFNALPAPVMEFTTRAAAMAVVLGTGYTAFKTLSAAKEIYTAITSKSAIATGLDTTAKIANTGAMTANEAMAKNQEATAVRLALAKEAQKNATLEMTIAENLFNQAQKEGSSELYVETYYDLENAKKNAAIATTELTIATEASTGANLLNITSLKNMGKAMLASPLFWVAAGSMAISGIITAVDYLTSGYERQQKKVQDLTNEYSNLQSQLNESKTELENVNDKLGELQERGKIEYVDPDEISKLQTSRALLENQVSIYDDLLVRQQERLDKEILIQAQMAKGQGIETVFVGGEYIGLTESFASMDLTDALENNNLKLKEINETIAQYKENISEAQEAQNALGERTSENAEQWDAYGIIIQQNASDMELWTEKGQELIGIQDGLLQQAIDLSNAASSGTESGNLVKEMFAGIIEKTGLTIDGFNGVTSSADTTKDALNGIGDSTNYTNAGLLSISDALSNLESDYTANKIKVEEYIESLENNRKKVDELAKQYPELADAYKKKSAEIGASLAGLPQYYETLMDRTKSLSGTINTLESAFKEQSDAGELSNSTILSLIDSGYALALQVDEETGAITLNKDMVKLMTESKSQAQIKDLEIAKTNLSAKFNEEAEAARNAAGGFLDKAMAAVILAAAEKKQLADLDAQIAILKNTMSNIGTTVSGGGGGTGTGGGGRSSAAVKEKKEEINEIYKLEVEGYKESRKLNEINDRQVYEGIQNMLKNYKLNATEREYLEKELTSAKIDLAKESRKEQTEELELLYEAEEQRIDDVIDLLKEKSKDSIEIQNGESTEKLDIISSEYLDRIQWIQNENSVFTDAQNEQMDLIFNNQQAQLEGERAILDEKLIGLSATNKDLYDEIIALRERNDEIKEGQQKRAEDKKTRQDAAKLAELEAKAAAEEDGEKYKALLKQIEEQKANTAEYKKQKEETAETKANNEAIAEKTKEITTNTKLANTEVENFNKNAENIVDNLIEALKVGGQIGGIEIPIYLKFIAEDLETQKKVIAAQTADVAIGEQTIITAAGVDENQVTAALTKTSAVITSFTKPLTDKSSELTKAVYDVTNEGLISWRDMIQAEIKSTMSMLIDEMEQGVRRLQALAAEAKAAVAEAASYGAMSSSSSSTGSNSIVLNVYGVDEKETAYATARELERLQRLGVI